MSKQFVFVVLAVALVAMHVPTRASGVVPRGRQWVGVSAPSQIVQRGSEQSGVIVDFPVRAGDRVAANQVLFRLSSELQELEVVRLESLLKTDWSIQQAAAELSHAKRQEKRVRELFEQKLSRESELEDRRHETLLARLKQTKARQERAELQNELAQAKARLAQRTVRSTWAGIVTQRLKQPGETVEKLAPVVEVMDIDPLWIEFECPVDAEQLFPVGKKVVVSAAARGDETRQGRVVFVAMKANPSSHTFRIRVATPNADHAWKAGLKMYVRLGQ